MTITTTTTDGIILKSAIRTIIPRIGRLTITTLPTIIPGRSRSASDGDTRTTMARTMEAITLIILTILLILTTHIILTTDIIRRTTADKRFAHME